MQIALGVIPVFLQRSAEVVERKGDGLRSGVQKCRKWPEMGRHSGGELL